MEHFFLENLGITHQLYNWLVLPLIIFCCRVTDVSCSTMRQIFVASGLRRLAPFLGIFEAIVWIIGISTIMQNLNNIACYIGYAAGFSTGIFMGMTIEEKLALGKVMVRVITRRDADDLIEFLRSTNFGFTYVEGQGKRENVKLIFCVVKRQELPELVEIIHQFNPNAFYTVEAVRYVNQPVDYGTIVGGGGLLSLFTNFTSLKRK
jgi:uncharacterized protein YebE (UPF0316 family)